MTGTDDVRLPCVHCGALNPLGAEICTGCGRRLDGPDPAPAPPPPRMQPEPPEPAREPESPAIRVLAGVGSFLGKVTAAVAITAASIVAFVVAVSTTCSYDTKGDHILLDLGIGVAAAVMVAVGLTVILRLAGGRR